MVYTGTFLVWLSRVVKSAVLLLASMRSLAALATLGPRLEGEKCAHVAAAACSEHALCHVRLPS